MSFTEESISGQGRIVPYGAGQALVIGDRTIPIPAGGSDTSTATEGGGSEGGDGDESFSEGLQGLEAAAQEDPVQPEQAGEEQSSGGQDFIEPYLEGLDPRIRPHVEERLEQFRRDQDAQVNKKFQKLNEQIERYRQYAQDPEQLEVPVAFYTSMVNDPINTLDWFLNRYEQELGSDLRSEVLNMLTGNQGSEGEQAQDGQQTPEPTNEEDRPLTKAEVQEILRQEREREQQERQQQQTQEQQRQQVNQWVDEAAKTYKLELDEDDPLRQAIITEAGKLFQGGKVQDGKQAIEMATEGLVKRLENKLKGNSKQQTPQPKTANGGQPPGQQKPDVSDPKARQEYALSLLTAGQGGDE